MWPIPVGTTQHMHIGLLLLPVPSPAFSLLHPWRSEFMLCSPVLITRSFLSSVFHLGPTFLSTLGESSCPDASCRGWDLPHP